ncbi:DMT family transporter [Vibrio panuliri]|uniref:ABC transporter permease n=1 Tax=Vibrio panuliri TaxID=1381081 RepID=A0ABX3F4U7_9VIBR|nr:DMT family transporter [Vibrio panuliri]KAB1458253.1 DMT family transporter [Vibrio panuliri]OLQ84959.1 ABC transporter permease [Vibrio panuliri]
MPSSISQEMSAKVWGLLILLSMLWGGSFFFVGIAVSELPPLIIVTLRVTLAAITLWIIALLTGHRPPKDYRIWVAFLGMGLLNNVIPFLLIVWGQTQIASGLASIINAATPIFGVVVASTLLPDEKATPLKVLGVVVGFIGVVVMIGLPALGGDTPLLAELAVVCASISYAFASVHGRRFKAMKISLIMLAAGQVTASSVVLLPIAFWVESPAIFADVSTHTWLAMISLAVFSTAFAYTLYFKILQLAGATNVLLVTLLVPVSAILLGVVFLGESLEPIHIVGMGLIALGLSAIDGRIWHKLLNRPSVKRR